MKIIRIILAVGIGIFTAALAPGQVVIQQDVDYLGPERSEKMDVYLPSANFVRPVPAVVVIHGGGWSGGDKRGGREQNFGNTLATHGYAVFSIDYALNGGGVVAFPQNLYDCKTAVRYLRAHAAQWGINPQKIATMGGSAGGHLAMLTGVTAGVASLNSGGLYLEQSNEVSCILDFYGRHNVFDRVSAFVPSGFTEEQKEARILEASPLTYFGSGTPPIIVFQGTADTTVPVGISRDLVSHLQALSIPHQYVEIEGAVHSFNLQPPQMDLRPIALAFLAEHLGQPALVPVPPVAPGTVVTFTFENSPETNDSVNGTPMAFDSGGTVGTYYPQDGVTLTMVEGLAPKYVLVGSNYTWDGTSYQASNTNRANHVGISNGSIPGTNDSNNFNPQESWTINFSHDIILRSINAAAIESGDMMQVTVGVSTFDFVNGSFDANDDKANPFGELVIPAGTPIKFKNSAFYPVTPPLTGSNPSAGAAWGLSGLIVEVAEVPEVVPESGGYDQWAGQIEDEEQVAFDDDTDSDGISNGLEYVLGGDPNVSDTDILPTLDTSEEATVRFVFYRENVSLDDSIQTVQYGSNLVGWTDIPVNGANPPVVVVEDQGDDVSKITVTIEKLPSVMFVRLKVSQSE